MKYILPIACFICACGTQSETKENKSDSTKKVDTFVRKIISDSTNILTGKTETLELEYIDWSCACANWITANDKNKYKNSGLAKHTIFIEPANPDLKLPLFFDNLRHHIKVTGQFYVREDYPQGTIQMEQHLEKAKVFRYTNIEVTKIPIKYSAKENITLKLQYNAIECTCAKWSNINDTLKTRDYIFLERANDKLLHADSLWIGNNLPLQIQVTGQFYFHEGYPFGFNPIKGNPDPAKVFRYEKIKILQNGE
jgi:hypothetical protein